MKKKMVGHGSGGLSNRMLHFGATLHGTRQFGTRLTAMVDTLELPTHCIKSNVLTIDISPLLYLVQTTLCGMDYNATSPLCEIDNTAPSPSGMNNAIFSPSGIYNATPSSCGMDNVTPSPCGMDNVTPSPCRMDNHYMP